MTPSSTPLLSRLEANRNKRNLPRPLYPAKPVSLSPFVRMARESRLRPTLINGAFVPRGSDGAA